MRESTVHEEAATRRTTPQTAPKRRTPPSTPRRSAALRTATHAIGDGARRVDAATPAERDRAVDALRAFAILGVVLGHWLVTALVADGGALHTASPLQHMPWLAPISWAFQTLAVFFLVGGHVATKSYASARARGTTYGQWLRARLTRLFKPVAAVLTLWTVATVGLLASGTGVGTVHTLVKLALSPLWFLLVFAGLTAATPLLTRLNPLWPLAVVLHVDLMRFGLGGPSWLGWVNVAAGWMVPYTLGAAWTRGELDRRRAGWVLLLCGAAATAALVTWAGYPASMVGVPGAAVSNLNPPTLAAVTFGVAQCGLALLLREPLRRWLRRPLAWAAVALVNLSAMTIFLWHQTSMMAVTAVGLLVGGLPGLHMVPDGLGWVAARLAWLPVFAFALGVCWVAFRSYEQGPRRRSGRPSRVVRVHRRGGPAGSRTARRA
ncbi:Peptidoglycan/LPS O-acetylase OafA/YrhL, contains acyltransferase and SGNH-hydrolase domains [Streptomyces mirabilis]|uniref:Peptidoglycan/LPS O-acetylase OafA/YrhL, contains acyltransferase and SGNH-hydrolase domains n=1 Tax=Streptomyces mirabilis TaxID=68239 RepID=A0A1I2VSP9_9ACTN|nr:Peptidoglycan/LPS O-acetylase OafA/YrhL, contains acyltransferase and SGNH-hydrolase domains [Streptomyces mirabilis]